MKRIIKPFERFFQLESSSSFLLFGVTWIALIWANSPYGDAYFNLWDQYLTIGYGSFELSKPLLLWINDGLMAIFFFLIGLEIKREIVAGELNTPQKAVLPVLGAVGGMLFPVLIFLLGMRGAEGSEGWAIPMAPI